MRARHLSIFVFILMFINSYGQSSYKHYNTNDGLPHDVTYNIFQDSKGYLWIGTDDGLSKFDGISFKNYSGKEGLTSNYVTDIEELGEDKYAIATWGGGLHFLENDTITKRPAFKDDYLKIYDITYFQDRIYTFSGISSVVYDLLDNKVSLKVFLKNRNDFGIIKTVNDSIFKLGFLFLNDKVYLHNKEPAKYNFEGVLEFFPDYSFRPSFSFLENISITAGLKMDQERYVFGTSRQLIFSDKSAILSRFSVSDISAEEHIHKILEVPDAEGEYIIVVQDAHRKKRLLSINTQTKTVTRIDEVLNLKTTISDALFDFEGNLWISTFGDGIYCYYYSNPKVKNILNGNYIIDAVQKEEYIYVLSPNAIHEFRNSKLLKRYPVTGFPKDLSVNDDGVSVAVLNASKKIDAKFNLIHGQFYAKTQYGDIRQSDTLFLDNELVVMTNEIYVKHVTAKDSVINLYTNKGKWMHDLKKDSFKKDVLFNSKIPSTKINDMLFKDGQIILATDKGLVIVTPDRIEVYNEKNGLINERVNSVLVKEGDFYLGTQSGLSLIKDGKVYNFSQSFGIQSSAINKVTCYNDQLWLSGNNGVSIVSIDDVKPSIPPKLNIVQDGERFDFNVVTYQDQKNTTFQYQLNEGDWVTLKENRGILNFNHFAPDAYNVVFRARNSHSSWKKSNAFQFSIEAPWYRIWWVVLLLVLSSSSVVGTLFFARLKSISKRNTLLQSEIDKRIVAEKELGQVRENIARDFHDDLGNKLASISLLSDVLSKKIESDAKDIVDNIKEDADYLYKGTKDFIFSLQDESNYLEEVQIYLSDFAEEYLHQFSVDFEVESDILSRIKLPHYWSKQIIYIFKEAITNTVKHARAKNARLVFSFANNQLMISFKDDGIGYDVIDVQGNGLVNMSARASKIGCSLRVYSDVNKGTTVVLFGKLP